MKTLQAKNVSYSEKGEGQDYFQVFFEEKDENGVSYVLLQRQFEFPDEGESYFECDAFENCGHYVIRKAKLSRDCFEIEIPGKEGEEWKISFDIEDKRYEGLKEVLKIILSKPNQLQIRGERG